MVVGWQLFGFSFSYSVGYEASGLDCCEPVRPSVLRYSNESSHAARGLRRSFVTVTAS